MKDSFGREITYARISLTDRCNLRCQYCMPESGIQKKEHEDILSFEDMEKIADTLIDLGINKIRITGGEPLVRKGAVEFLATLGKKEAIKKLSLTTNGTMLKEYAKALYLAGVNSINVSLDTLDSQKYREVTRNGDLTTVLEGLEVAKSCGFGILKINVVLLKGINDNEVEDLVKYAQDNGFELRFIELMPFCSQSKFANKHFISLNEIADNHKNWKYLGYIDNSTAEYYLTESGNKVGLIKPLSQKFCRSCNRVRITAAGELINCLHNPQSFDLKPYLDSDLGDYIEECVSKKPLKHCLEAGATQMRDMNQIGG